MFGGKKLVIFTVKINGEELFPIINSVDLPSNSISRLLYTLLICFLKEKII
jgi:hypothetical protein